MVSIHNLIAAVSPDVYCDSSVRKDVKKIVSDGLKEGDTRAYLKAAEKAVPISASDVPDYEKFKLSVLSKPGLKAPKEEHSLTYDSPTERLEPMYFWLLDFLQATSKGVDKIFDNFVSTVGSGHFSELGQKATRMQEEAMKILGTVNTVLRSILNIVYDLKDFKLRLQLYDNYHSEDKRKKEAALLSLKQTWMDSVDIKRGQGSINALSAGQLDFVTLRDAFMKLDSLENADKIDLNERVRRILKQRIGEFFHWVDESEKSLRQRYEIERRYLQSQYSSLQLYSRWLKPYLEAARKLEQNASPTAALVNTFDTIILELTLLAQGSYDPEDDINQGNLPIVMKKVKLRKYIPFVIVEFNFRGIPQKSGQHYTFGGKADVKFTSYALNEQEFKVLKEQLSKTATEEAISLIEGTTTESLEQIKEDIEGFISDKKEEKKESKKKTEDVNPFSSLFDFLKPKESKKKEDWKTSDPIPSDSDYEKIIRSQAIIAAREKCFTVFDTYKKAHGMPSHESMYG